MRRLLTFAAVTLVSFALSAGYWLQSNQADEYLSLTLYKPFVYRALMPMSTRALTWLGVAPNWAIVIMMTGAGVSFYYALMALVLHYYKNTNELLIVGLWSLGLCLFWYERLPSDWATACLFSLALLFLAQDKLLAYCLLFPIVCLNRETAFLLIIFYLFFDHDIRIGRDVVIMLYQVVVWFGLRLSLMFIFRHNGGVDAWIMPVHNFQVFFANPIHSLLHITIAGVILWLVFKGWYRKPYNLRLAFCIFVPILLIAYWIVGQPFETRVLWECFPVIACLILPTNDIMTELRLLGQRSFYAL